MAEEWVKWQVRYLFDISRKKLHQLEWIKEMCACVMDWLVESRCWCLSSTAKAVTKHVCNGHAVGSHESSSWDSRHALASAYSFLSQHAGVMKTYSFILSKTPIHVCLFIHYHATPNCFVNKNEQMSTMLNMTTNTGAYVYNTFYFSQSIIIYQLLYIICQHRQHNNSN